MQSLFWAAAIYGFLAQWLVFMKRNEKLNGYTGFGCLMGYLAGRGFVWIQLKNIEQLVPDAFLFDAALILGLTYLVKRRWREFRWEYLWCYVSNPVVLLSLTSVTKMAAVFGLLLFLLVWLLLCKNGSFAGWEKECCRDYICLTLSGMLYLGARLLLGQSGVQCMAGDEAYPTLWILAVSLSVLTIGQMLYGVIQCRQQENGLPQESETKTADETEAKAPDGLQTADAEAVREPFNGKDAVLLFGITVLYAILVCFRLGSMEAPQSYLRLSSASDEERQLIFQFEEAVDLKEIQMFLGVESKRTFSFSEYDFEKNDWQVFDSEREITSAFTWNEVPVNRTLKTLAVMSMDEEAYLQEIVFLDTKGNQVLPVNWKEYEAVFDEQDLYPGDTTYYEGTMFDEVYHARTAYEFVHKLPLYEITHPPLGKLLISLGIRIFGMTPFGWRIVCALFGVGMVPLMYLFARQISGKRCYAVFGAILFCFEFMHLTLSRIATLDIIIAYFVLGMFYFMYLALQMMRKEALTVRTAVCLLICGSFSACAAATKWTGFYALAGIGILFLSAVCSEYADSWKHIKENRGFLIRLFGVCIVSFILLPTAVYLISYLPYTWCGEEGSFLRIAADNFKYMLSYHTNAKSAHPYSSEWYEWLWNKRPLLDAFRRTSDGKVSSVATFGNPLIWLGGLAAFVHNLYLWRCRSDKTAGYLCIFYLSMLMPWLFIYRTVFIYQYFISSISLILLLVYSFLHIRRGRREKMLAFGAAAGILFVCFFPVLTGYPVSESWMNQGLEWMRSWVFA